MAITWAEGLLAGAAGVADYALQEQAKRDQRALRIQEMRDQMALHQAKSEYSLKLNDYAKKDAVNKQLKSVQTGSFDEQFILYRNLGYPDDAAAKAAQNAVSKGTLLKRPGEAVLPKFLGNLDELPRNPTQSWARDFVGKFSPGSSQEAEEAIKQEVPTQVPEGQAPEDVPLDAPETGVPLTPEEGQEVGGFAAPVTLEVEGGIEEVARNGKRETFNPFAEAPKYEITKQDTIRGGKKGKLVSFTDPSTLQTKSIFLGTDVSGMQRIDPLVVEGSDGKQVTTERLYDPTTDEIISGDVYTTKSPDPEEPVTPVKLTDIAQYLQPATDNKPAGQFYGDFPKTEREKWENLDTESWFWDTTPEGFEQAIAGAYLDSKNATIRKFKGKHVNNPNFMSEMRDVWKASAYIRTLGVDGVVDAIQKGAIDKDQFFGNRLNRLPDVQQIQQKLGITNLSNPEEFNKLSVPKYQF